MTPRDLLNAERRNTQFVDLIEYLVVGCMTYGMVHGVMTGIAAGLMLIQLALISFILTSIAFRRFAGYSPLGPEIMMLSSVFALYFAILDNTANLVWVFTASVVGFICTGRRFATLVAIGLGGSLTCALVSLGELEQAAVVVPGYVALTIFMAITVTRFDHMQDELVRLNSQDNLTGAYNRNFLDRIRGSRQFRYRICRPVMIDLDDFKGVNDIYGHLEGDRVLKEVSDVLSGLICRQSTLFRIGGDEFMILMLDTSGNKAAELQKRILSELPKNVTCGDRNITATVGIGPNGTIENLDQAIEKADFLMLDAKANSKRDRSGDILSLGIERGA